MRLQLRPRRDWPDCGWRRRDAQSDARGNARRCRPRQNSVRSVASPTDPISNFQFSVDEIKAAVEDGESHKTYVTAHAYAGAALTHVVELSVRTIEHGNLIDDETAAVMAKHNTYAMPTPVEYDAMSRVGARAGVSESALKKNDNVRAQGLRTLDILECHGVKIGVRTDLLGDMHQFQSEELSVRSTIVGAFEIICQATQIGAEIVGMEVR